MNSNSDGSMGQQSVPSQQESTLRPPGFAGIIADYLFNAAPRPNLEAATAGTIGLLAGINGGAYTVSSPPTGLNLYVALVMKSAIGKESMVRAIQLYKDAMKARGKLIPWAGNLNPIERRYLTATRAASGPALTRMLSENPAHAMFTGELGLFLKQLCAAPADSHLYELKRLLMDLYEKSGPGQEIGGINYAKRENNIDDIIEPAFSLIGDTTPESFYEALTDDAENGFMSRWTVIERLSFERPELNETPRITPDPDLLGTIAWMVSAAEVFRARGRIPIAATDDGKAALADVNVQCDLAIDASSDNAVRAVWNRAYMKIYRLAGLLAVADFAGWNWWADTYRQQPRRDAPCIEREHVGWAALVEGLNVKRMTTRIQSGETGSGDDSRRQKILALITEWFDFSRPLKGEFAKLEKARRDGIVPWRYFLLRTCKLGAFKNHRLGSTNALRQTVESLKKEGILRDVGKNAPTLQAQDRDRASLIEAGFSGECWGVVDHPCLYE